MRTGKMRTDMSHKRIFTVPYLKRGTTSIIFPDNHNRTGEQMIQIATFLAQVRKASTQKGWSLEETCLKVKALGYDAVCCEAVCYDDEIHDLLKRIGLKVSMLYSFIDFSKPEEIVGEKIDALYHAAERSGANCVMPIPDEDHSSPEKLAESLERNFRGMNRIAGIMEPAGIPMVLEEFNAANKSYRTCKGLQRYLDAVPYLQVCLDTGNFSSEEDELMSATERFLPLIKHCHLKDHTADCEFGNARDCPLGYGRLPMKQFVARMVRSGYDLPMTIEHFDAFDQWSALTVSCQNLRNWLEEHQIR